MQYLVILDFDFTLLSLTGQCIPVFRWSQSHRNFGSHYSINRIIKCKLGADFQILTFEIQVVMSNNNAVQTGLNSCLLNDYSVAVNITKERKTPTAFKHHHHHTPLQCRVASPTDNCANPRDTEFFSLNDTRGHITVILNRLDLVSKIIEHFSGELLERSE